ncbi:hypothetical protein GUITHDRAFT_100807 [Guillardia theta CCMP2712]|uniref:Uncharacterized protein n=1 Tax=Guillardia theta (strain CCMP2712) TaxID=905079 RepID=L1JZ57_GUITC|nr:hypothetical protein GUITHDRAFT_100807 [Guillardia theta CCMP2712]EKX53841.1 hypothetical protein GUITHDRAFT_100807 [Guillardia theta CCMP2712]|eukprot:XP_005840821.1 hypothetical protein GUITHDRAFT_100807 [Guillardia theta CCMP2712]
MVGIMIGAPMALVTYGSITDAIVNNEDKTFSLDKNKTDIPGVVLANRFYMSVGVGAAVGLGFGFVATLAAGSAKIAMATRSNASTAYADMRYRLLPMR